MTPLGAVSAGMTCPACGVAAPAAARFCPACGERLAGGLEERRVVTVLFADLVDTTSLVESLDPEAARDLLNETFRRLAAEVRRFGGTLEKYIGDAILAVFGFPTGHDDAARAPQEVDVFSRARLRRAEARLASTSGDPAAAVALLERSLAELEGTGHRLDQLRSLVDLAPALRRVGRAEDADAVAMRALERATTMGAHALIRRLTEEEEVGR